MAVEMIVKVPGLLKAEGVAAIYQESGMSAVALNKAIVITDGDVNEWLGEDIDYIVSNLDGADVDEVIDLSDSGINAEDVVVRSLQSVAQMALLVSEPGPVAVKWLEKVVADDDVAGRQANRTTKLAKPKTTAKSTVKAEPKRQTKASENKQVWYKAKDGKGFTQDPTQARMYAGHPVLAKGSAVA